MKKIISAILTLAMSLSLSVSVFANTDEYLSSGGAYPSAVDSSSGGGGGISKPVESFTEYSVSGTIYLPAGAVAPKGGIKIYCGFGGVSYGEISTASVFSTEDYIEEESTVNYENIDVVATIPEGQNYVSYTAACKIADSYDGIYGKFWVEDNVICGETVISNKQTLTSPVNLKANVYEYSNLNCILNSACTSASYSINCDNVLASEKFDTDVYVIADDGYDKYISRANYNNLSSANGVLNLESNGDYCLYYYVPSSTKPELQKLDSGLFNIGTLDTDSLNAITLKSRLYISGTINLPTGYAAKKDINITINTVGSEVNIVLPKGVTSIPYTVGAFSQEFEYLRISVSDENLISGYVCDDGCSFDKYEYDLWYDEVKNHNSVKKFDITLAEQYLIKGQISLPKDISMSENTFFIVYVTAKSTLTGYRYDTSVSIFSDIETAQYKIPIPKTECVGKFIISYDYGSYSSVTAPTHASTPLTYFIKSSSGGGGGGNHGSSSSACINDGVSYKFEKPSGLLYDYKFYINDTETTVFEADASKYEFVNKEIQHDLTLFKVGDVCAKAITGYFDNYADAELYTMIVVTLYDSNNNLVDTKIIDGNGSYYFDNLYQDSYKIGFWYNDKQYYYNGKYLVDSIDDAEVIKLSNKIISTHNDVHCDNIFNANIKLHFNEILINNNYYETAPIKIYDPYGNVRFDSDSDTTVTAKFSSFYIGIGDYYVSEFTTDDDVYTITGLVDDIDHAYLFEANYIDAITKEFYMYAGNTFTVNAATKFYNSPITSTLYEISDTKINLKVSTKAPVGNCKIMVAAYSKNGQLADICTEDGIYDEDAYTLSMNYSSDIYKIKTMVWDDLKTLSPLGIAEEKIILSDSDYNEKLKYIANAYFMVDNATYYINGCEYPLDVPPKIIDGVVYLPLRTMGEASGAYVEWYDTAKRITLSLNDTTCMMQIENNIVQRTQSSGETEEITLSAPPICVDDQILVPCIDISQLFDFEVYNDENNHSLAIFDELSVKTKYAYDNGLLNTEKVDMFSIKGNITRAEIASLLVELYENSTNNKIIPSDYQFTDDEYKTGVDEDVAKAYALGVMLGFEDGTFGPNHTMMYSEVIKDICNTVMKANEHITHKYITVPDYDSIPSNSSHWATSFLYNSKKLGLLDGVCYDTIDIDNTANRKDAIGIISNAYYRLCGTD